MHNALIIQSSNHQMCGWIGGPGGQAGCSCHLAVTVLCNAGGCHREHWPPGVEVVSCLVRITQPLPAHLTMLCVVCLQAHGTLLGAVDYMSALCHMVSVLLRLHRSVSRQTPSCRLALGPGCNSFNEMICWNNQTTHQAHRCLCNLAWAATS